MRKSDRGSESGEFETVFAKQRLWGNRQGIDRRLHSSTEHEARSSTILSAYLHRKWKRNSLNPQSDSFAAGRPQRCSFAGSASSSLSSLLWWVWPSFRRQSEIHMGRGEQLPDPKRCGPGKAGKALKIYFDFSQYCSLPWGIHND